MKIVVAPNPFKGSLGAPAAARALAAGVRAVLAQAEVVEIPVADGGEGTVEALVSARGGFLARAEVEGPLGDPVRAEYGLIEDGRTAVLELAAASGLPLVAAGRLDPLRASTFGFGQLLEAARRQGVERIIAGIGGSATNDAGAGMAQALGFRLLDGSGQDLPQGGAALSRLEWIDASGVNPGWRAVEVVVAVDVNNPLCGPRGASAVYGPQKGATPEMVRALDAALSRFAEIVGPGVAELAGSGAAGGTGAGLRYFLDARLTPGAPLIVGAAGLEQELSGAAAVLTGEGRVDAQSVYGKGPIEVARRARKVGVPVALIAAQLGEGWEAVRQEGVTVVERSTPEGMPLEDALNQAVPLLQEAAGRAVGRLLGC